jgi:hypothetical protein
MDPKLHSYSIAALQSDPLEIRDIDVDYSQDEFPQKKQFHANEC